MLRRAGLGLAAISYDDVPVLRNFSSRNHITYPLLSDRSSEVIGRYGVGDRAYRKRDQLDLEREEIYNGDAGFIPVYGLSYPAVFVIDPGGTIVWRLVSEQAEFRLSGAAILERSLGIETQVNRQAVAAKKLEVHVSASNTAISLGGRVVLGLTLDLPPGSYVLSGTAKGAAALTWEMHNSNNCWTTDDPQFPQPEQKMLPFRTAADSVYEQHIELRRELAIRPVIKATDPSLYENFQRVCQSAGRIPVTGTLNVQVCDSHQCFPPQTIPLAWSFTFTPPDRERVPVEIRRENRGSDKP